jgi:hypothetical protein
MRGRGALVRTLGWVAAGGAWIVLLGVGGGTAMPVPAGAKAPGREFEFAVRRDFFAGLAGDNAALDRAMKACEKALVRDPKNAEALVWHGGGLAFQAGQRFAAGDREAGLRLRERGHREMDEGARLGAGRVEVLIPHAALLEAGAYRVPDPAVGREMFARAALDFEEVARLQADNFGRLCEHARGELLGGLAEAWNGQGDAGKARSYLERIEKELPGTPYARRAGEILAGRELPRPLRLTCLGCHTGNGTR